MTTTETMELLAKAYEYGFDAGFDSAAAGTANPRATKKDREEGLRELLSATLKLDGEQKEATIIYRDGGATDADLNPINHEQSK